MFEDEGDGWYESQLYVEVDGEIVSIETGPAGNYSTFEFGVDDGDIVNLYYLGYGSVSYEESYVVTDANNQEIAASGQSGLPVNSMGLLACPQTPSCGYLEIVMSNEYGEGWANNTLDVYRNGSLYLSIPFYWGGEQTTMIPADNNDEFDFIYLGGTNWDPESEGYVVSAPDGSILVNQNSSGQVPESVTDLIVCQNDTGLNEVSNKESVRLFPNPANTLVSIQASQFWLGATIQVIDAMGKDIITVKDWNGESLDVSNFHSGIYIIELKTSEQFIQKRLVVE